MKQQQRVMQKLEIVKCSVSVKDTINEVKDLTSKLKELFKVEEDSVPDENANALVTVDILSECRSIDDIEIKAAEFKYREETGSMVCLVCEITSFQDCNQSRAFRDLKSCLKRHLQTGKHLEMV